MPRCSDRTSPPTNHRGKCHRLFSHDGADWTLLTVDFGETVMREPLIHMLIPTANPSPLAIETIKMRAYEHRVQEVEHSTFTALVMSLTGGLGNVATVCYKRLASMLSSKRDRPYSSTIAWIRCALSFAHPSRASEVHAQALAMQ